MQRGQTKWSRGPDFLLQKCELWPKLQLEQSQTVMVAVTTPKPEVSELLEYDRVNCFVKTRRVVAFMLRAIAAFRRKGQIQKLKEINALSIPTKVQLIAPLIAVEIKAAERCMIVNAQMCAYPSELESLRNNGTVHRKSSVWPFNPL